MFTLCIYLYRKLCLICGKNVLIFEIRALSTPRRRRPVNRDAGTIIRVTLPVYGMVDRIQT